MPDSLIDPELSVVVPFHNEEPNVEPLYEALTCALVPLAVPYELILIEDGSTDGTFLKLARIQRQDERVRVIRFTRNFGQTAAFAAGFAHARGRLIATIDGDLQNDPADLPRLLAMAAAFDVVAGWRRPRRDPWLTRRVPSIVANWLIGIVSGVRLHDNGCSLKVFNADMVKPLKLRAGMHRFLPALASQLGARVTEVVVHHRPRQHGRSNYGLSRTFRVVADLVHLRGLMRQAVDPATPAPRGYEISDLLETPEWSDSRGSRVH
jgi:glycosyltransferase involved in cell wall biosynthesis